MAELLKRQVVALLPAAGVLLPAGDRAATAELAGRQQPPGNTGAQLVDGTGQAGAVINPGSTAVVGRWGGEQGLDGLPRPLGDTRLALQGLRA